MTEWPAIQQFIRFLSSDQAVNLHCFFTYLLKNPRFVHLEPNVKVIGLFDICNMHVSHCSCDLSISLLRNKTFIPIYFVNSLRLY